MYKIAGFTDEGDIVLGNKGKWVVHRGMGHITHGYCTTPQAAQGMSVDRCYAAVSANSLSASNVEQLYVILSRGKKSVELLTDKRPAFIDAVARYDKQQSATELLAETPDRNKQQRVANHAFEVQRLRMFEKSRDLIRMSKKESQRLPAHVPHVRRSKDQPGPSRGGRSKER